MAGMIDVQVDGGTMPAPPLQRLEEAVRMVLMQEGVEEAEISVALLDDPSIQALNRDHLGRDRPTDVIAFALWEQGEPVTGDVYLGWEQALRQAPEAGVPQEEEVVRLAIHGVLHVLGWDHPEPAEARPGSPMFRRQEELVRRFLSGS